MRILSRRPPAARILYAILGFIVGNYMPVSKGSIGKSTRSRTRCCGALPFDRRACPLCATSGFAALAQCSHALVDVCRRLECAEVQPIDASMQPLFRDVTDH